jgi:hypothetical protein
MTATRTASRACRVHINAFKKAGDKLDISWLKDEP